MAQEDRDGSEVGAVLLPDGPEAQLEVMNVPPGDIAPAAAAPITADDSPWDSA